MYMLLHGKSACCNPDKTQGRQHLKADNTQFLQAVLLQCLEALCQYSDQVVVHHKAVLAHLLPALAAAVGRQGESRDSRFLCLKLLCDVILHFLLETDLYSAPSQQQQSQASHAGTHINDTQTLVRRTVRGCVTSAYLQSQGTHSGKHCIIITNNDMLPKRKKKAFRICSIQSHAEVQLVLLSDRELIQWQSGHFSTIQIRHNDPQWPV